MTVTTFPSAGIQALSSLVHLLGVALLSHFLSRRFAAENLWTARGWRQLTWPRMLIIAVLLDSWMFVISGGVILFGVGVDDNMSACNCSIWICIFFYASSKVLVGLLLVEKVYVVWSHRFAGGRLRSPIYLLCMSVLVGYIFIFILACIGRISNLRDDGFCEIGLHSFASILLIALELFVNILLTVLFIWPLARSKIVNPVTRRVAYRALVAAGIALLTPASDMIVLIILHGRERGWMCLGICSIDVVLNAAALFWVTTSSPPPSTPTTTSTAGTVTEATGNKRRAAVVLSMSGAPVFTLPSAVRNAPLTSPAATEGASGGAARQTRERGGSGATLVNGPCIHEDKRMSGGSAKRWSALSHAGTARLSAFLRAGDILAQNGRSVEIHVTQESATDGDCDKDVFPRTSRPLSPAAHCDAEKE